MLSGSAGPLALLLGQTVQQVLLGIKPNGATVVIASGGFLMAINDVEQLKWQVKFLGDPGTVVRHIVGVGRLVDAGEHFFRLLHTGGY